LFNSFAKIDVSFGHARRDLASLEERQHPFHPSGMLYLVVSLGTLRSSSSSSRVY
jgi:hypothetical protein